MSSIKTLRFTLDITTELDDDDDVAPTIEYAVSMLEDKDYDVIVAGQAVEGGESDGVTKALIETGYIDAFGRRLKEEKE